MKILKKYKRLFTFLLTIILCFVIVFQSVSISASAETVKVQYYSVVPNSSITSFGSTAYLKGMNTLTGSLSQDNATIFHTATFGSLGKLTNNAKLNGNFIFQFYAPAIWVVGFNKGDLYVGILLEHSNGSIEAIQVSGSAISSGASGPNNTLLYTVDFTADIQAQYLNTYLGWSQCDVIGVGIRCNKAYSGNFIVHNVSCVSKYDVLGTIDGEMKWFNPVKMAINHVFDNVTNIILKAINLLGVAINGVWNYAQPVLQPILENVIVPVIDNVLKSVNAIAGKVGEVFSPLLANIINFFTPYFNQISTLISNSFINLVTTLNPFINNFITAITPSFNSIVKTLSDNIHNIFNECFKPDINSQELADFVALKDEVSNKFPIFSQLKQFLVALFEPTNYAPNYNTDDYVSVNGQRVIRNTGTVAYAKFGQIVKIPREKDVIYEFSCSYNFVNANGSYPIIMYKDWYGNWKVVSSPLSSFNDNKWRNHISTFSYLDDMWVDGDADGNPFVYVFVGITTGQVGSESYYCDFEFYRRDDYLKTNLLTNSNFAYGLYGWTSYGYNFKPITDYNINHTKHGDVEIIDYYTEDSLSNEFVVNIYGKQVSALNFDWYLPYKKYGDICVIAFCYLAFIWHTFKRLPSLI